MNTNARSEQIIGAAADMELRERIIALAAQMPGVQNPQATVSAALLRIVGVDLDGDQPNPDSIASIYEYAVAVRENALRDVPPTPGSNPAAVTDDHIRLALEAALNQTTEPTGSGN